MEGLSAIAEKVIYKAGCNDTKCPDYDKSSVITAAQNSDVIVVCLGTGTAQVKVKQLIGIGSSY